MSNTITISNDWGNILQISCKTSLKKKRVLLCSANGWIGTRTMFSAIPKRCCHFSVVQSFQFKFATHLTYIQGKHSRSIDWKYNYRECWCYIIRINDVFRVQISDCYSMCLQFVCKQSDENHSVHGCPFLAVIFWHFFSVWWLYLEINQSLVAEIICTIYIFIHSCKYTTQHFK